MGVGSGRGVSEKPTPNDVTFWVTRNLHRLREMHARTAPETAATTAASDAHIDASDTAGNVRLATCEKGADADAETVSMLRAQLHEALTGWNETKEQLVAIQNALRK